MNESPQQRRLASDNGEVVPSPRPRLGRFEQVLLAIALLLRAVSLVDFMTANPGAHAVGGDAGVYWDMAAQVAEGQLQFPEPFHSAPLYPYLLGLIRWCGGDLLTVYIAQSIAWWVTAIFVFNLALIKLGRKEARAALLMYLLLMEPAFFSTRILPATTQLLVIALLMTVAQAWQNRPGYLRAAGLGFLCGLSSLAFAPMVLAIGVCTLWVGLKLRRGVVSSAGISARTRVRSHPVACALTVLAGGLLPIAVTTWHNYQASSEIIPITAHGGLTFSHGNTEGATGIYTAIGGVGTFRRTQNRDAAMLFERVEGRPGTYRDVDAFFWKRGWRFLIEDPARGLLLTARKAYWFLSGRHYSDIGFATLERRDRWLSSLWVTPVHTAWLMIPAIIGLVIGVRGKRLNLVDVATFLVPALIVVLFWYSPRYRLPAIPITCIAGGLGLIRLAYGRSGIKVTRRSAALSMSVLALGMVTGPINAAAGFDGPQLVEAPFEEYKGDVFARLNRFDIALIHYMESQRHAPDSPRILASIAGALNELGRFDDAITYCDRLDLAAGPSVTGFNLRGTVYLRTGRPAQALESFRQALHLSDGDSRAHLGAYYSMLASGRQQEGFVHLQRAVELEPTYAIARAELGVWHAQQEQFAEAEIHLRAAVRLAPGLAGARYNLGIALLRQGRKDEAQGQFRETIRLDPTHERAQRQLEASGS